MQGLEILPLKSIEYKNRAFKEFDLDAALARKPGLLLVDELAIGKFQRRWFAPSEARESLKRLKHACTIAFAGPIENSDQAN